MSRSGKWFVIAVIVAIILLLLRMKAIAPASILTFILFLAALAEKLMRIQTIRRMNRSFDSQNRGKTSINMTIEEAREILELGKNYTKKDVKNAYHNLIKKLHPDTGGSKYLAAKINMAKDMLFNELEKK